MPIPVNEEIQEGVPESYIDLVTNADVGSTPLQAMVSKTSKRKGTDSLCWWQVEKHRMPNLKGTPDLQDVSKFNAKKRKKLYGIRQKSRDGVAVGDLAGLNDVAGVSDEMVSQVDGSMVVLSRSIEARMLSNHDHRHEDDGDEGSETRGLGSWLSDTAQGELPVPDGYRPQGRSTVPFDEFDEDLLKSLSLTARNERKGKANMLGIVGPALKEKINTWLSYRDDRASKHSVLSVNQDVKSKTFVECVDRIELESANIDLMTSDWLFYTNETEGEETFASQHGGLFIIKEMLNLDFHRDIRVIYLENKGGGERAFADAVWLLEMLNPLGQFSYVPTAAT